MTEYARIDGDQVIERRVIQNIPPHKQQALDWRPVVYEGSGPLSDVIIEADRVRVVQSDVPFDQVKANLKKQVKDKAEEVRQKFITEGYGKSQEYREVYKEAIEILALAEDTSEQAVNDLASQASTDPHWLNMAEETYPMIYPDIGVTAPDLVSAARVVVANAETFQKVGNAVKKTVYAAKAAIDAASDVASAKAAFDAIKWPG